MFPGDSTPCYGERVKRRWTVVGAWLFASTFATALSGTAAAQSNPGFFPARYVACHEEKTRPLQASPSPSAPPELLPVPKKRAPRPLDIAPLEVMDVAVTEPLPSRAPLALAQSPAKVAVTIEGENDFHCIGFTRGRAGIVRAATAPSGTRFLHHSDPQSWRLINVRAAGAIGLAEVTSALRKEIERPVPEGPADHTTFDLLDSKLHAMRALLDLGDKDAAMRIVKVLKSREDQSYSIIYKAYLEPFAQIDPEAAQAYAVSLIDRIAGGHRRPKDPDAAPDDSLVREVLPLLTKPNAADLAIVMRLTADTNGPSSKWHDACEVLAARLRLGDISLRKELRAELSTDLRTNRATVCYSAVMPFAFPGEDPDEVDTLLFRHRYEAILRFLERARSLAKENKLDARWKEGQKKILEWLKKRSSDPDIAGGKSDTRFQPQKRALHLTALAVLGDAQGKRALDQLIVDPEDSGTAPWIAAEQALRFDLAGAADHAEKRLRWAIDHFMRRYDTTLDPMRGPLLIDPHVRVIDALAARKDARFALGLLDENRWGREAAAVHLAKQMPAAACEIAGNEAKRASPSGISGNAIDDAFWTLSILGDACRGTMWKLLQDPKEPAPVRGMALEVLAMMRDARAAALLESTGPKDDLRAHRQRAKIIFHAKE